MAAPVSIWLANVPNISLFAFIVPGQVVISLFQSPVPIRVDYRHLRRGTRMRTPQNHFKRMTDPCGYFLDVAHTERTIFVSELIPAG